MVFKKVSPDEEEAIRVIFRLDPYILTDKFPYCGVKVGKQGKQGEQGSYCTRECNHEGPHICIVHYSAEMRAKGHDMKPELKYIWHD